MGEVFARRWRKRFFWLPLISPALILPIYAWGYSELEPWQSKDVWEDLKFAGFLLLVFVPITTLPLWLCAWLIGRRSLYQYGRKCYFVVGAGLGLCAATVFCWFLCGLLIAAPSGADSGFGQAFAFMLFASPIALIAAFVGGGIIGLICVAVRRKQREIN